MIKNIVLASLLFCCQFVSAQSTVDEIAEQYVKLALALGEHEQGYIDAYYGPEEWLQQAANKKMPLKNIVIAAKSLQDILALQKTKVEIEKLRLEYLSKQLGSVSARGLMLLGSTSFDFDTESKALYDTQAPKNDIASFSKTMQALEELLPGEEPLPLKVEKFKKQFIIPKEKLKSVFDVAIEACRERTIPFVELLGHENFTLEFVTDKPWSGYNWYKGNSFSLIQVNVELPIEISRAVDLGCHEGYPGHHTYNGLLEANLYRKRGWVEYSVYPLFSPQSLIAEGSANYGIEMAFPGDEKLQFEKEVLYPLAGLDPKLAGKYDQVNRLIGKLSYAANEVARLYLNKEIDGTKAAELLQQYALMSPEKAAQRVKFFDTYGAYVINYNWGKDLVKQWVEGGGNDTRQGRWKRFSQLLSTPRLPSTLN